MIKKFKNRITIYGLLILLGIIVFIILFNTKIGSCQITSFSYIFIHILIICFLMDACIHYLSKFINPAQKKPSIKNNN